GLELLGVHELRLDLGLLARLIGLLILDLVLEPALAIQRVEFVGLVEGVAVRWRAMVGDGRGQLGAQLLGVAEHVVAPADQVGDHGLDVLAPLRALFDDPAGLGLRGLHRLTRVLLGLAAGGAGVLLGGGAGLLRIGIGRAVGLVGVGVRLVPRLLRLGGCRRDRLLSLLLGLGADLLGALLGLSQDRPRALPHSLELALDGVGPGLVAA